MNIGYVADIIRNELKRHGYNKRIYQWTKYTHDSILVIELNESTIQDNGYTMDIGVYYKSLGNMVRPKQDKCHLRRRVEFDELLTMTDSAVYLLDGCSSLERTRNNIDALPREWIIADSYRHFLFDTPVSNARYLSA